MNTATIERNGLLSCIVEITDVSEEMLVSHCGRSLPSMRNVLAETSGGFVFVPRLKLTRIVGVKATGVSDGPFLYIAGKMISPSLAVGKGTVPVPSVSDFVKDQGEAIPLPVGSSAPER